MYVLKKKNKPTLKAGVYILQIPPTGGDFFKKNYIPYSNLGFSSLRNNKIWGKLSKGGGRGSKPLEYIHPCLKVPWFYFLSMKMGNSARNFKYQHTFHFPLYF